MKRAIGLLPLLLLVCGCGQRAEYYEVVFVGKNCAPQELMATGQGIRWCFSDCQVVRIVAGERKLSLYLLTLAPKEVIEKEVAELADLPEYMSDGTVKHLPDGLPPKPKIEMKPTYKIRFNERGHKRISASEITTVIRQAYDAGIRDDGEASQGFDLEALQELIVEMPDGKKVPFEELATITVVQEPSFEIMEWGED